MSFRVVILTNKVTSLKAAEQFLRNRQWDVFWTSNLREAIAAIIQRRPDYVLIAADHPNKKVRTLPKLINQAIEVKFIGFVEASTSSALGALNDLKLEYNLFPPVSGPSIERMILKVKKEAENKRENTAPGGGGDDSVNVPGSDKRTISGGGLNNGSTVVQGAAYVPPPKKNVDVRDDFMNFLNEESAKPDPESNVAYTPGSSSQQQGNVAYMPNQSGGNIAYMPTQQEAREKEMSAYAHQQNQNQNSGSDAGGAGGLHAKKPRHYSELPSGDDSSSSNGGENGGWVPTGNPSNGPGAGHGSSDPSGYGPGGSNSDPNSSGYNPGQSSNGGWTPTGTNGSNSHSGPGPSGAPTPEAKPHKDYDPYASNWESDKDPSSNPFDSGRTAKKDGVPIMEHAPIDLRKRKDIPKYKQDPSKYRDNDSIFVKGTQQALDEASQIIGNAEEYEELKSSTNVACITIESPRFSGYLVAAMGKDRPLDAAFIKAIKNKLFEFLKSHGEVVKEDDTMDLQIQQVDFEEWAIQQADFLRKSVHGTSEVAMAFFPNKETSARLEDSVSDNMLKMSLDELRDDVPVEFDCYIYMPTNNRFLLYTPEGKPIYGNQRGRLREKGVTHLHLRKESVGQVKKYRAQCFLNERIAEFRKAKAG